MSRQRSQYRSRHRSLRRSIGHSAAVLAAFVLLAGCQTTTQESSADTAPAPQLANPPAPATVVPTPTLGAERRVLVLEPEPILEDNTRLLAFVAPLSGETAPVGQALLNAAQLAFFDVGADDKIELKPYDSLGSASGAELAVRTAIEDGADIILGPLFSQSAVAASPFAQAAGVPMVSFSNNSAIIGGGVYAMGFTPDDQVRRVVYYAAEQGVRRFAALLPDTAYGRTASRAFADAVADAAPLYPPVIDEEGNERAVELVDLRLYDPNAEDFTGVVRAFARYDERRADLAREKAALEGKTDAVSQRALARLEILDTFGDPPYEAVLLADAVQRMQIIAPLLPFYDVDPTTVRMLGTMLWDQRAISGEPALTGGWFAAPAPEERQKFLRRYELSFGQPAPSIASLAYDATALAVALHMGRPSDPYALESLTFDEGFLGVDGLFRLTFEGLVERGLVVKELTEQGPVVLVPAPQAFFDPAAEAVVVN